MYLRILKRANRFRVPIKMSMLSKQILAFLMCAVFLRGGVSYKVTLGAEFCHEVTFPKWTAAPGRHPNWLPKVAADTSDSCHYLVRQGGRAVFFGVSCFSDGSLESPEHYAGSLGKRTQVSPLTASDWDSGQRLPEAPLGAFGLVESTHALLYRGQEYPRSGPAWHGDGSTSFFQLLSLSGARIAVTSWDGVDYDPGMHSIFPPAYAHGRHWLDIYDVPSVGALVRIQGGFRGPDYLSMLSAFRHWYGDRYFVMPLKNNLRRALICDLDAASLAQTRSDKK